jgi:hypothetical protein
VRVLALRDRRYDLADVDAVLDHRIADGHVLERDLDAGIRGGVRAFDVAVANTGKPYWIDFSMDYTVFGYLAAICVFTGILFGLAPALHISRLDVNENLKESGRGSSAGSRVK